MPLPCVHIRCIPENRRIILQGASPTRALQTAAQRKYGIPAQKIPERCENRSWRSKRKARNMTEPTALTIRHMKIEDYPLVYGLWTRCTGFTMRDIDDCKDAIKTFLKRNPDTCFVAEDDGGRIIGAILAGHDGRRSRIYHTAVDPTRAVGALARCWWAVWLKRFVRSVCRKSPSVCPQTTMPATISGNGRALQSVTIWFIGNCRCNNKSSNTLALCLWAQ